MSTMRVAQLLVRTNPFVEREISKPSAGSVRIKVEERAAEAYEHMMSGKARFRAVLTAT